jgi:hypothetical protein
MKGVRRMAMNSASKKQRRAQTATDRGDMSATLRPDTSAFATAARVVVSLLFAWHRRRSAAKLLIGDEARRITTNIAKLPELPQLQYYWTGAQAKKRVHEPPTAAATAAWSRADRFGPAPERGHKARSVARDTARCGFGRSIGRP